MKNKHRLIPGRAGLITFLIPLILGVVSASICSAQNVDPAQSLKKHVPYTLRIKKGTYWLGGSLGLSGSVAPMGQYIGTSATLSMKGGYHIVDKFSVGFSVAGGLSLSNKKSKGVYNRGISLLVGPLVQYMIPISKTFFLAPIGGASWGPMTVKSMVSQVGAPEEFVKIKGHAFCEYAGIGPFFEVIPGRASFGAQFLVTSLQQKTTLYNNSGEGIPGTRTIDNKTGPAMVMEFRLHF